MIYLFVFGVAACDFLMIYNLLLLGYVVAFGHAERNLHLYRAKVRQRALHAALWFALSTLLVRVWELGVFDGY